MIDRKLVGRAQKLIAQMQPLSEVSAAQGGVMGDGHASSQFPPGLTFTSMGDVGRSISTLERFGGRLDLAEAHDSNLEYSAAIDWGQRQYDRATHGRDVVPETPAQFRARIVESYEGVIATVVAARERCSVTLVRDARQQLGRTTRFGHKLGQSTAAGEGTGG